MVLSLPLNFMQFLNWDFKVLVANIHVSAQFKEEETK